jgi:hypothetical protein
VGLVASGATDRAPLSNGFGNHCLRRLQMPTSKTDVPRGHRVISSLGPHGLVAVFGRLQFRLQFWLQLAAVTV